jgi:RNase P subunit RPR2
LSLVRKDSSEVTLKSYLQDCNFSENESDLEEKIKFEINQKAKIELVEKKGRRFCKYCGTFKVGNVFIFTVSRKDAIIAKSVKHAF